jgi:SAM-dependent methyltransferase
MGDGHPAIMRYVLLSLQQHGARSVLDLGCGRGQYGPMVKRYLGRDTRTIGVDGYLPYLAGDDARTYDVLVRGDLFDFVDGRIAAPADAVLCMDVIEHFDREKAKRLSGWLIAQPLAYLSTPLFWLEQDAAAGNALEKHQSWFTFDELVGMGWLPLAKVRWDARGWIGAFKSKE